MYTPNFTMYGKKVCLSLHYNGDNSYLFVNGRQIAKLILKLYHIHYVYQIYLKTLVHQMQQDYMNMFMILGSIIKPLQIIKYMIFTGI